MLTNKKSRIHCQGTDHSIVGVLSEVPLTSPTWQPDGPTLRFKGVLKVTGLSKSKAYELMKTDAAFPQGTPLYDGERSPKYYWTDEVMAWAKTRTSKFRSQRSR